MGCKTLCFGLLCILFAYYIYIPIPENVEERWKVQFMDALLKTTTLMATLVENIGLMKFEDFISTLVIPFLTKQVSDENLTVIDTNFSDIPVRLYLPKKKSERQRRAVIFIHGGIFVLGSYRLHAYDFLNRYTANQLDAVVMAIDYRLAPQYPFPTAIEDCVSAVKFFLQDKILAKYGVDSSRICISGDSSGGALVAKTCQLVVLSSGKESKDSVRSPTLKKHNIFVVRHDLGSCHGPPGSLASKDTYLPSVIMTFIIAHTDDAGVGVLQDDPEFKNKIKAQALIYPGLQMLDTFTPSYREYEHGPILSREMVIKLVCLYVTEDKELPQAMQKNQHMPQESRHLFKFANWSVFLSEKYKKNHVYKEPVIGKLKASYPALVDGGGSPLLVSDSKLQNLPLTYILTCEHDLVRDDGLIYVARLKNVGVQVTHDHIENGIHGAVVLTAPPLYLHLGFKIRNKYISWLKENL